MQRVQILEMSWGSERPLQLTKGTWLEPGIAAGQWTFFKVPKEDWDQATML
jgi:hypothetical protein